MFKTEKRLMEIIKDLELTNQILRDLLHDESQISGTKLSYEDIDNIITIAKREVK